MPPRRISRTITFSLPPDMYEEAQRVKEAEGRDMSELVREAIRLYMEERVRQEAYRLNIPVRNPARGEPVIREAGTGTRGRTVSEAFPTMWRRSPCLIARC